jgi:hypothetical protein
MVLRIFSLLLLVLTLGGCAEPPYNNIGNDKYRSRV